MPLSIKLVKANAILLDLARSNHEANAANTRCWSRNIESCNCELALAFRTIRANQPNARKKDKRSIPTYPASNIANPLKQAAGRLGAEARWGKLTLKSPEEIAADNQRIKSLSDIFVGH